MTTEYEQNLENRRRIADELVEIAKHKHLVGKYARSVESGWLGKITDIEYQGGDLMCKMTGADEIAVAVAGVSVEESLSDNDVQWFAPEDLRIKR